MSGASINKKLQKAYGKIGNKLGFKFKLYRSLDYLTPVQTKNYLGEVLLSYATDESFKKPIDASYKQYNLFLDTINLRTGDIFINEELNKTFVLVNKDPIVTPQAIEASHRVTISRPSYTTTGGFKAVNSEVATNIPAAIYETGSGSEGSAITEVSNKSGVHQWTIWIWLPVNNIKLNDLVVDNNGNESYVTSIEFSPVGYKIKTQSTKVGS